MKVREVMKKPYSIDEDITLREAADIMSRRKIGSLILVDKAQKIKGIITERDVLKNFHKDKKISKVMSKNVILVCPGDDINKALMIIRKNKIKRLPVVDKDKLVGVITLTDIAVHADVLGKNFIFG